jgi:hypothetical protein
MGYKGINFMKNYTNDKNFKQILFEESYVLEVIEGINSIIFIIEAALTEDNPYYTIPIDNEAYCYKNIKLIFDNVHNHKWIIPFSNKKIKSADLIEDIGTIDLFQFDKNQYVLGGEWGKIEINSAAPKIELI